MKNTEMFLALAAIIVLVLSFSGCNAKDDTGVKIVSPGGDTDVAKENVTATGTGDADLSVRCSKDADCGKDTTSEPYCFQGNAVTPTTKMKCLLSGTVKSYCIKEKTELTTLCDRDEETCRKGKCLVIAELPCSDSDGGKDYHEKGKIVDALFEEHSDDCEDDVLTEWYCSNDGKGFARSVEYTCPERCVTGACVD